ncbi:sulfite exporter TauE/SafE family protein [Fructilactobacillus fructivorans]|uniref:sulfite exporter TauE/SafE family protein n=1 Tax=Fructilactobacillus fructivorans TaxID=1614 RepID=UPI001CDA684F|nr:sulfite exporter TauE/SafE family protein [Fructilactobacillus fructivorans]
MESLILKYVLLIIAGIFSGIMGTAVGLASVISYPSMLAAGLSPIVASVTNIVGFAFSNMSAVASSQRELKGRGKTILKVVIFAGLGSAIGSLILLKSSNKSFADIAPVVIMLSGLLIMWPKSKKQQTETHLSLWGKALTAIALTVVGMYLGYFGAGGGILIMAILLRALNESYAVDNAIRNVMSLVMNWISAIIFIFTIQINWPVLITLTIGLIIGGYIGPAIVRHIPSNIMKYGVGILAILLAIYLGIKTY